MGRTVSARVAMIGVMSVAGVTASAGSPRMLPREVRSEMVLVRAEAAEAVLVCPAEGRWAEAAQRVSDGVFGLTGVRLPVLRPEDATLKDGLRLRGDFKRRPVVFVGNVGVNRALFDPYVRGWLMVDEENLAPRPPLSQPVWSNYAPRRLAGASGHWVETYPDPWGTGAGHALVGASREESIHHAADAFVALCEQHATRGSLVLPRACVPGPDDLAARAGNWRRLARPANEDWVAGFKRSRSMHLGYNIGAALLEFTLVLHAGVFTAEETNDIEQEMLENILLFPEKVWWYRGGRTAVDGRHELFKNPRLYLAIEHLLKVGRPNPEARARLETMAAEIRSYLHYAVTKAYRSDHEGTEADHGWQSAMWAALVLGDWGYFTSGRAREAALYALQETDNAGGLAGHIQYGDVEDVFATATVRNALRLAAWWYRDGRFRWLLENMPYAHRYDYGFPIVLPLAGIPAREPTEWLGVQWLPVSEHSHETSLRDGRWEQPPLPREKSVDLLTFRSGFGSNDQYLAIDGFQNHFHPLGLGSIVRYADLGKLFLVAHTGKDGNYYKSGVAVSAGTLRTDASGEITDAMREGAPAGELNPQAMEGREPWGAEIVAGANLPSLGLSALRVPEYHGSDWTRFIFWRKGAYFVFLDQVCARAESDLMCTNTWRTWSPATLERDCWVQRQGDVTFRLKPAFAVAQRAGAAPAEEYQNEVVPYLLRQTMSLRAPRVGDSISFQNLLYASSPARPAQYEVTRISPSVVLVRGGDDLAFMGVGPAREVGVETDACMFYLSPEHAAVAGGKTLSFEGESLVTLRREGDAETTLSGAAAVRVRAALERLWAQARTPARQESGQAALAAPAMLDETWRFRGFRPHARRLLPLETKSEDGQWRADLGRSQAIEGVVAAFRGEPSGVEVAFSDDGFRADIRPAGEAAVSSRVFGPHGKSVFTTQRLFTFRGQTARHVRLRLPKGLSPPWEVEILSPEAEPAHVMELKACDLDPADGEVDLLCRTRDNQLAVLTEDGKPRWQRDFEHNLISLAALDLQGTGRREVVAVDAASTLWRFAADGAVLEQATLHTDHKEGSFFQANRAYSLGVWQPRAVEKPSLIMGTYQSIAWRTPVGRLVCYPEQSDEPAYRSGYLWRGLIYWERALERGLDMNGDGVEDQAFLARGWATIPRLIFFDGQRLDQFAEYVFPNGQTLGLEIVSIGGERTILAANEFRLALYSLTGKEMHAVRFDTPAAAYAVDGDRIFVAKRDGILLALDRECRTVARRLLDPDLRSVAASGGRVLVASDEGLYVLDSALAVVGRSPLPARAIVPLAGGGFAAALVDGSIARLDLRADGGG